MNSSLELRTADPDTWKTLNELFNGKKNLFPCLFAIRSFNKGAMRVSVINERNSCLAEAISSDLIELSKTLSEDLIEPDLSLITYLSVIKNSNVQNNILDETFFLTNLLEEMFNIDPESWPDKKTKKMGDEDFEFFHNGRIWFPVLLSPSHCSKIRQSPFTMIAFQPGRTFDYNKVEKKDIYERMRKSIHRRIDIFYDNNRPYYLSEKSSGKNICQYIGHDKKEFEVNYIYKELKKHCHVKINLQKIP